MARHLLRAPRREQAGGRLSRAHFRDGAGLCGISSSGGLRGFRARAPTACEWAPVEAQEEKAVALGTPELPQK